MTRRCTRGRYRTSAAAAGPHPQGGTLDPAAHRRPAGGQLEENWRTRYQRGQHTSSCGAELEKQKQLSPHEAVEHDGKREQAPLGRTAVTLVGQARPDLNGGPRDELLTDHRLSRRVPRDGRAVHPPARDRSDMAADNSTDYSPIRNAAPGPSGGRGGTAHAPIRDGSTTHRRTKPGREQDRARSDNRHVDRVGMATPGSTRMPVVSAEQVSTQLGETALPQMEAGILGTTHADSASTSRGGVAVPRVVAIDDRADFLAGCAAGQAAAAACGPLPDEIARDVVLIVDTTTPPPVPPRRPRGGVRDAG